VESTTDEVRSGRQRSNFRPMLARTRVMGRLGARQISGRLFCLLEVAVRRFTKFRLIDSETQSALLHSDVSQSAFHRVPRTATGCIGRRRAGDGGDKRSCRQRSLGRNQLTKCFHDFSRAVGLSQKPTSLRQNAGIKFDLARRGHDLDRRRSRTAAGSLSPSMLPGIWTSVNTTVMSKRASRIAMASSELAASTASNASSIISTACIRIRNSFQQSGSPHVSLLESSSSSFSDT
jgi:hypothetical protein